MLQAAFPRSVDASTQGFDHAAPMRRIGGTVDADEAVDLRILVDHSLVEVFTGCGRALSTRCALHVYELVCQL